MKQLASLRLRPQKQVLVLATWSCRGHESPGALWVDRSAVSWCIGARVGKPSSPPRDPYTWIWYLDLPFPSLRCSPSSTLSDVQVNHYQEIEYKIGTAEREERRDKPDGGDWTHHRRLSFWLTTRAALFRNCRHQISRWDVMCGHTRGLCNQLCPWCKLKYGTLTHTGFSLFRNLSNEPLSLCPKEYWRISRPCVWSLDYSHGVDMPVLVPPHMLSWAVCPSQEFSFS